MATDRLFALRRFVWATAVFGRCFSVSLLCTLLALPVLHYFGGTTQLAGAPLFEEPGISGLHFSEGRMLALRLSSVVLTLAFFFLFARYGLKAYRRAFGIDPSWVRIAVVSGSLLVFALAVGCFFLVLLKVFQPNRFSDALLEYTTVTLWPFAFVPIGAGMVGGIASSRHGNVPPLPADIENAFRTLQKALASLPGMLSRAVNVVDPLMDGNVSTAALAALSASSILTAGLSSSPSTFVLLFALPLALTLGNGMAYFVLKDLYRFVFLRHPPDKTSSVRFVLFSALLSPGLAFVSVFCFIAVSKIVNALYVPAAIPLWHYYDGLVQHSQQWIAYAIALSGPAYAVAYFLNKQRRQAPVVEQAALVDG